MQKRTYQETLEFLFAQLPMFQRIGKAAYKADLSTTIKIDEYLNHPHQKYPCIHIAGTNGKGSVSSMLSSILQEAGYKVGLFTSPHLKDFRERIVINKEMINEVDVINFVEKHEAFFKTVNASFFEYTTAMAMQYFANEKVDIAILETGMGGRLDSTNIVTPILSVITNISLDHTQFLGDTIAAIAKEKAGIIKQNIPVVIGERQEDAEEVFISIAKEKASEIYFAEDVYQVNNLKDNFLFIDEVELKDKNSNEKFIVRPSLKGKYQTKNILSVAAAAKILKTQFPFSNQNIIDGIEKTNENTLFKGRWQILNQTPLAICDAAHNPAGIKEVIDELLLKVSEEKLSIVLATTSDKDLDTLFSLLPENSRYYFSQPNVPRGLKAEILKQKASEKGIEGKAFESIEAAYQSALNEADKNQIIYVGGSIFTIAEIC